MNKNSFIVEIEMQKILLKRKNINGKQSRPDMKQEVMNKRKKKRGCFRFFITGIFFVVLFMSLGIGGLIYITPPPPKPPVLPNPPEIGGVAASLLDANRGDLIAEKDGTLKIYPASTTKILTAIIALEEGKEKLGETAVISQRAMAQEGTNIGLRPDMPVSLHELLYGMMLVSGNDAAVSVAETVGGSYDHFIEMMNEKAVAVGALHSHFTNANGLTDPSHYTTANDMVKIAQYAMRNRDFRDIVSKQKYPMKYQNGIFRNIENRNEFLSSGYEGANGIKTGMTEAAGDCLVASAERDGQLIIVAVYDDENRWEDVQKWLDYGFEAVKAWETYERKLDEEPAIYKFVNQTLGKEPKCEKEKRRDY